MFSRRWLFGLFPAAVVAPTVAPAAVVKNNKWKYPDGPYKGEMKKLFPPRTTPHMRKEGMLELKLAQEAGDHPELIVAAIYCVMEHVREGDEAKVRREAKDD